MIVTVVGGGPAGMMAAITAAENGNKVTLVDKNDKLGKKLFLTGKGRCNITNACPVEELFDNIVTNKKFLYSAFYGFDNTYTVSFFNDNGLATKVERGERVFPVSDHSSDVIRTLVKRLESLSVKVLYRTEVTGITVGADSRITGVIYKNSNGTRDLTSDVVIMATGGRSYPLTGSDGRAFLLLDKIGVKINGCEPSLVPLTCDDELVKSMQGLSLKNVGVNVDVGKKSVYSGFGEMLFTHFGLSGPLILSASTHIRQKDYEKGVIVHIDLKPALDEDELDKRILRDFEEFSNKDLVNSLSKLLPNKLISPVILKASMDPHKKVNLITKEERRRLGKTLKAFDVKIKGNRGFDEAIITRGGVDIRGINPSTMEHKTLKGLYFAGEMIDTDALTGGFNLQIAWSTGHLAGNCR